MSTPVHPLPLLARSLVSVAVLSPWVGVLVPLLGGGLVVPGSRGHDALAVSILVGVCASLGCLLLVLTDPVLDGRRGRWLVAFVLAAGIAPVVYLWSWQWRRPAVRATDAP